jgi:hypothetical protein
MHELRSGVHEHIQREQFRDSTSCNTARLASQRVHDRKKTILLVRARNSARIRRIDVTEVFLVQHSILNTANGSVQEKQMEAVWTAFLKCLVKDPQNKKEDCF